MRENHPLFRIGGPLLGILLVIFFIRMAVNQFQADQIEAEDAARLESQLDMPAEEAVPAAEAPTAQPAPATQSVAVAQSVPAGPTAPADVVAAINSAGCAGCHIIPGIPGANGRVGPDLTEIGVVATARAEGLSTEEYIRQSILEPNAVIAPDCWGTPCPPGVMLQSFAATISESQLETIVGYLSKLGTDEAVALTESAPVEMDLSLPAESVLEPFMALPKEPAKESQIALGKYLFFDERLSGNNSLSCASCHQPDNAFSDGQALSDGYPSTAYFRNAQSLYNTVFQNYLYWDGRMDGGDMPTLVRDHLTEAHFMNIDGRLMFERLKQVPEYNAAFQEAFGGEPTFGRVLNAVTAYVQTLNSPAGSYDAALAGDTSGFDADQLAGYELFTGKARCSDCHTGGLLSDGEFYNTGVATDQAMFDDPERYVTFRRFFRTLGTPNYRNLREDTGLYSLTLDDADWGKFRTPSLREVGRTAPYMHNGSLATLEDVVAFYNDGGGEGQTAEMQPLGLSDGEIGQLIAFLESLSSEPVEIIPPVLPDYAVMQLGDGSDSAAAEQPTEAAAPAPTQPEESAPASDGEIDMEAVIAAVTKGGCAACHVMPGIPGGVGVIGPDMTNIGVDAATRVPGESAEEYLRLSIMEPNAFIAPQCPTGDCLANLMPVTLATTLTPEEIDTLVNWMLTLGSGR